jgi:hypothetical protein
MLFFVFLNCSGRGHKTRARQPWTLIVAVFFGEYKSFFGGGEK